MKKELKTFCRICDVCCGMIATVEDDRITGLKPNPDHVVSQGYACPKGLAYDDIVHSPDRVRSPIRRNGSVNENRWQTSSWDDALADIGSRIRTIIDESGPDSVALYVGNGAGFAFLHPFWAQGFLMGIGSISLYGSATQDCSNKFAVARRMYGFPMLQPVPDFENGGCFIVMGGNPAATKLSFKGVPNPSGAFRTSIENGCRVFHINPRRTESVDWGGEHIAIRPDTDVFFLMAFANELFRIGGIDEANVSRYMKNRDELEEVCRDWTPERQAEVTGVDAQTLRRLVAIFTENGPSSLYLSTGLNMGRRAALCGWLVEALNAVSGNLDREGGTLVGKGSLMDFPRLGSRVGAMMGTQKSRLGNYEAVNEMYPGAMLADEILSPGPGKIRVLLVAAGNPLLTLPDTAKTEKALRSLDLLVTVDIFRSVTGDFAHWVLPGVTPYEHPDIGYIFHSMMGIGQRRFLQYTDTVVPPVGSARDELWIWQNLCSAAGGKFYGSSLVQNFIDLRRRLSSLPGVFGRHFSFSHEGILNQFLRFSLRPGIRKMRKCPDGILLPEPPPGSFLGKRVRSKDGLVDLAPVDFVRTAEALDGDFQEELGKRGTLKLINMRGFRSHNSFLQSSPTLMKGIHGTNHIHINPKDGESRSLRDGEDALVWSSAGCIRIPVKFSDRMSPGSVAIPFGWGQQRARGLTTASGTGGANVNWLFPSGRGHLERLSLMAHLSGLPVELAAMPRGIPALVLAGGKSRRFGSDKALVEWKGKRLLNHVLDMLSLNGYDAVLSLSDVAGYEEYTQPRLIDPDPELRTPLNGLLAAARTLKGYFFVTTSDAPALKPEVLLMLETRGRESRMDEDSNESSGIEPEYPIPPVVIGDGESLNPFPGLYHSSHLHTFESAFHDGKYRITDLVTSMNPVLIPVADICRVDPNLGSLKNINTPSDLALFEAASRSEEVSV